VPAKTTKQIETRIAELETRIAELVDLLPDSEADEAAWFKAEIAQMRAEQTALRDEQTALEIDRAFARAEKAAKRAISEFNKFADATDINDAWLRAKSAFDRALDRGCVPHERGATMRAELSAARDSACTWAREVLDARADRAARAARAPIRALTVAEQQYERELRLMRI
jgi:hypothetical protein